MSDDEDQNKFFPPTGESRSTFEGNRFEDEDLQQVHAQLMREKEEPSENFSYPPLMLIFLFMLLSFGTGIYLIRYSGDFSVFAFDIHTKVGAESGPVAPPDPLVVGKSVFVRQCSACHQADGSGLGSVYPPVAASDWVQDGPERLIKVILSGLQGEVQVNGTTYRNAMTPFGALLSDSDVAAVLTYLRTSPEMGNDSYAVSEELVAQVRTEYGDRSSAWTQAELDAIHGPVTGEWAPEEGSETPEDSSDAAGEDDAEEETGPANGAPAENDQGEGEEENGTMAHQLGGAAYI